MKKLGLILLAMTLMLLSPLCLVKADNWVEVARFQGGSGEVSEDHFTCDYNEWRIKWEFDPGHFHFFPEQHSLTVVTYREGEDKHLVAPRIYDVGGGGDSGTSYVYDSYGEYYMLIRSMDIESYTIIIEQNIDYTQEPTPTPTFTPSPSPELTPTPPEGSPYSIPALVVIVPVIAITVGVGLLVFYFEKRKH
jgi:hypothetical protein